MHRENLNIVVRIVFSAAILTILGAWDYPPLSEDQLIRLETAYDGRDHRESAFVALLENARRYDGEIGDASIRLHPDPEALIADPGGHRGDLCRLEGVIQQQANLASPYAQVREWFVRDDAGRPLLVYLAMTDGPDQTTSTFRDGERVEITARFYKTIELLARDGVSRSYAAFVGARPRKVIVPSASSMTDLLIVLIPVAALLVVFLVLFIYVRRQRSERTKLRGRLPEAEAEVDESAPLPDDPADALSELRHRAEADEPFSAQDSSA